VVLPKGSHDLFILSFILESLRSTVRSFRIGKHHPDAAPPDFDPSAITLTVALVLALWFSSSLALWLSGSDSWL